MPRTIAVDVDSVVADLHEVWLDLYNTDYNDNLTTDKILDWTMMPVVKPECGLKIYEYLEDSNIYWPVKPIKNALASVKAIRMAGDRVVFPTSTPIKASGCKYKWLVDNGFLPEHSEKDYMEVSDKSLVNADVLIDDYWENLANFDGMKILFHQPWNEAHRFDGYLCAENWVGVLELLYG